MKEKEFLDNVYRLLSSNKDNNKISVDIIMKCISNYIKPNVNHTNISVRDFLYNNSEAVISNKTLIAGSDILGQAHARLYSPKPDLAFAPFNLSSKSASVMRKLYKCIEDDCQNIKKFIETLKNSTIKNAETYRRELEKYKDLIYIWLTDHFLRSLDPVDVIGKVKPITRNPRSFIAVEVCFSGSMKHTLGSLLNASILGYYGIVVVNNKMLRKALRLKYYLLSITALKEINSSIGRNVFIITYDQFLKAIK